MSRATIEQAIRDQEVLVDRVVLLLEAQVGLERWPEASRAVFAQALDDSSVGLAESWKVICLRRHLFGPRAEVPVSARAARGQIEDRGSAERLRSDLPGRVRHRIGCYLLDRR